MNDKELLDLYRKKRAVDGLNGRTWDAEKHFKYDKEIAFAESCHLTSEVDAIETRRQAVRVGITIQHNSGQDPDDISNAAAKLYFSKRAVERELEKTRKTVIPATHAGRLAEGRKS